MTEEKYKREISFTQSVSSGIIAFHGSVEFDNTLNIDDLLNMLRETEKVFRNAGYKVATDIKPKEEKEPKKKID